MDGPYLADVSPMKPSECCSLVCEALARSANRIWRWRCVRKNDEMLQRIISTSERYPVLYAIWPLYTNERLAR